MCQQFAGSVQKPVAFYSAINSDFRIKYTSRNYVLYLAVRTNKINWHGCIATDVDGSIGINFEILSFLSVYIVKALHTSVWSLVDNEV
jgi:hypothetical protein